MLIRRIFLISLSVIVVMSNASAGIPQIRAEDFSLRCSLFEQPLSQGKNSKPRDRVLLGDSESKLAKDHGEYRAHLDIHSAAVDASADFDWSFRESPPNESLINIQAHLELKSPRISVDSSGAHDAVTDGGLTSDLSLQSEKALYNLYCALEKNE